VAARAKLEDKFSALKRILGDLSKGAEAVKMAMACSYCLERPKVPIRLQPCGHLYCESCRDGYVPACAECKSKPAGCVKDASVKEVQSKIGVMEAAIALFRDEVEHDSR
jgi:hypothetical protein